MMWAYYAGLDLGQSNDYSALCILEEQLWVGPWLSNDFGSLYPRGWYSPADLTSNQIKQALQSNEAWPSKPELHVRHLERFQLGTPYPEMVEAVARMIERRQLAERGIVLAIDKTGVGAPVFDLFIQRGLKPLAITITGGNRAHRSRDGWTVPKRDLVGAAQSRLQSGTLGISAVLPESVALRRELQEFKVKINTRTGHDSYEAWREGTHDDLVLSVAMACWWRDSYNRNLDKARQATIAVQGVPS